MDSQLSPVIANFFMEHFEETALAGAKHKPLCCFRYGGDISVIWPHGTGKLSEFLKHLKSVHQNIQFTMENNGHLLFFDIVIYRKPNVSMGRKVYRKTHSHEPLP
jgi:hypothetical protein